MVIKIKLLTKDLKTETWMFGNSYKHWFMQFQEFIWMFVKWWDTKEIMRCDYIKILDVECSQSAWIGWGGLKWCKEEVFQDNLNREGCQEKDPDNPKPRLYVNMKFEKSDYMFNKCRKFFRDRLRIYKGLTKYQVGSYYHSNILKNLLQDMDINNKSKKVINE